MSGALRNLFSDQSTVHQPHSQPDAVAVDNPH